MKGGVSISLVPIVGLPLAQKSQVHCWGFNGIRRKPFGGFTRM